MTLKQIKAPERRSRGGRPRENQQRSQILLATGRELPMPEPRSIAQVLTGEKAQEAFGKLREAAK